MTQVTPAAEAFLQIIRDLSITVAVLRTEMAKKDAQIGALVGEIKRRDEAGTAEPEAGANGAHVPQQGNGAISDQAPMSD